MFFLIWGTKYIDKEVEGGIVVKKRCPKCKEYRDLVEIKKQKWFSIFYIPIFPYGSEESSYLKCRECGTNYYLDSGDVNVNDKSSLLEFDNKIVITCPSCKTKLKIKPFDKEEIEIKCGNCKHVFVLKKNYK